MLKEKRAEKHATHGIKQVELLNYLLNNLSQFNLKPTTKLVLMYLAGCYNPKHADVFPKQKTIADRMGVSERSVISAIQELHKEGLVISERKYTNRYKFTARILNLGAQNEDFLQSEEVADTKCKDFSKQSENFAPPYIEQKREQEKEQTIKKEGGNVYFFQSEEDRILEDYAVKHGAKNVKAYIATLKSSGSATKIICEYKKQKKVTQRAARNIQETQELITEYKKQEEGKCVPTKLEGWEKFGIKFGIKKAQL